MHGCSGIKARNRWSSQTEELRLQPSLCGEGGKERSYLLRGYFHLPLSDFFPFQKQKIVVLNVGNRQLECVQTRLVVF